MRINYILLLKTILKIYQIIIIQNDIVHADIQNPKMEKAIPELNLTAQIPTVNIITNVTKRNPITFQYTFNIPSSFLLPRNGNVLIKAPII